MKFGCCTAYQNAPLLAAAGYDYIELGISGIAAMSEEEFATCRAALDAAGIYSEAANLFFPATMRLTGPNIDLAAIGAYIKRALGRMDKLGMEVAVIGSSGARNIPECFDMEAGRRQFADALTLAGELAEQYDITIAVEPLNHGETNLIFTVQDGIDIARRTGRDNVATIADLYHMHKNGENYDAVRTTGGMVAHVHIAYPPNRSYPTPDDDYNYAAFFAALRDHGYDKRISVEGAARDFENDIIKSMEFFRRYF